MADLYYVPSLPEAIAAEYDYLRRVAFRLTRDHENLSDYVQESYLVAIKEIDRYDSARFTFRRYLAQRVILTVRTLRKTQLRERQRLADNAALGDCFASVPDRDQRKMIKLAWSKLPTNHRKILRRHFAGTLPSDQRMNLSRARKALNLLLQSA